MIGLVLYLLPRHVLAVQFIFSLIIMDTKITCLAYNHTMNSLEMTFKYFQLKLNRPMNWVKSLVHYGQLFKLYLHRSAPFHECNHESIVLSVEKSLLFIKLPDSNISSLTLHTKAMPHYNLYSANLYVPWLRSYFLPFLVLIHLFKL